ncbi:MAG: hypothetical protein AMXMBFR64_08690 [Myxococcales bacterium]
MHAVWLKSIKHEELDTVHRVVRKQNRPLTDKQIDDLLAAVEAGREQVVRAFAHEEPAENLVKELAQHGAVAEIREQE